MLCYIMEARNFVDYIRKLFDVINYSERGSNACTMEIATFMFIDLLDDCEKG